jgi:murein L,D-transpeptidase YafK
MIRTFVTLIFYLFFLAVSQFSYATTHPEQRLLLALSAIQSSELSKAETILKLLIKDEPEFKLAHLLYADILKAKVGTLYQAGMGVKNNEKLQQLLIEVKARWQAKYNPSNGRGKIPASLSHLDERYLHAIVIDLKQSRLFVFENIDGHPKQVADYYVSMGRGGANKEKEGDLKTPVGVYFVQSYIPDIKLSDKYGAGAYPINYPNAWDLFNGRTGSGIWLHGTRSGTYNRSPMASEGCVVLPNNDLIEVGSYIRLGQTPVLIGEEIKWLSATQWQQQKSLTELRFNKWIDDWQSMNTENYLSHYSKKFSNGKKDFNHWVTHKRRVAKYKKQVKINVEDVSLLMHPDEDVMVATFHQRYQSDNFISQSWKRQYWRKEADNKWRIIFEGEIDFPSVPKVASNK